MKNELNEDDVAFCKRLTVEAGVTALPVRSRLGHPFAGLRLGLAVP